MTWPPTDRRTRFVTAATQSPYVIAWSDYALGAALPAPILIKRSSQSTQRWPLLGLPEFHFLEGVALVCCLAAGPAW
jgi:hypothetical protein